MQKINKVLIYLNCINIHSSKYFIWSKLNHFSFIIFIFEDIRWQISIASVADNCYDGSSLKFFCQSNCHSHRPATTHTGKNSLFLRHSLHHIDRIFFIDVIYFVDSLLYINFRKVLGLPLPDSWNFCTRLWLYTNYLNFGFLLLQIHAGTCNSTCGSHWRDKMRYIAVSIPVNLWTCSLIVRKVVIRIIELVKHYIASLLQFL